MRKFLTHCCLWAIALGGLFAGALNADQAADEATIRKSGETYTAAFNKQDAKALAALWSPEAVYTNPLTGEQVVGRPAIEKQFATIFAGLKKPKLVVKIESIQFISPNVAVERGTANVVGPDNKEPSETNYTAVHVKREGKWLLDRVTEEDVPIVLSHYQQLKELEWMIGNWVDQDDKANVETSCHWSKNQNFIIRSFAISIRDRIDVSGMQVIGWDPAAKQIRSWVFDSDGGFGEGVWSKKGDRWYVQTKDTLTDGQKATSQNVIRMVNKDSFTWQAVNRQRGGQLLPNIDEVLVVRKPAAQ